MGVSVRRPHVFWAEADANEAGGDPAEHGEPPQQAQRPGEGELPPAGEDAVVAVNVDPGLLHREFAHVRQVATFWNGLGVSDDEQGATIFFATGLRSSWAQAWPAFRDYS